VDQASRTEARASLSAMAATLLACGGAGLIAGAPDWVTRVALAKTPPMMFAASGEAQRPSRATNDGVATATAVGRGPVEEPFDGAIRLPPAGMEVATAADQLDLEHSIVGHACGAPRVQQASVLEGDGAPDAGAFTELRNPAGLSGCHDRTWTPDDLSDELRRSSYDLVTVDNRTVDDGQGAIH
jgi:hypothetical protein